MTNSSIMIEGHAFHPELPKGKASGNLRISDNSISFERDDTPAITLPIHGLEISLGGASNRLVFIQHPAQPDWRLFSSDLSILKHPAFTQNRALQQQIQHIQQKKRLAWGIFGSTAAIIVLLPLFLLFNMDKLTALAAPHIPVQWEQQLGETAFQQYRQSLSLLADETTETALLPLVEPLLRHSDNRYTFQFHISNDATVNAFALPGGIVVINSGLILEAKTAAELQGVLAHELVHVIEQHGVRNLLGSAGIYLTINAVLGDVSGLLAVLIDAAPLLLNQSYSRDFETEADEQGLQWLLRANIDPQGMVQFFETLKAKEEEAQAKNPGSLPGVALLSTHPATDHRITHLESLMADLPHQSFTDFEPEFSNLQQTVREFVVQKGDIKP